MKIFGNILREFDSFMLCQFQFRGITMFEGINPIKNKKKYNLGIHIIKFSEIDKFKII